MKGEMKRDMKRLRSLLLGAGLLAGCTVGPDYRRPAVETPQSFRFQGNEAPALANSLWWEQFGDPTLNELIAVALRENQDVKIAASRIELFLGQYASTRSLALPQVGANLGGRRQRQPEGELGQAVEPILEQYEGTLSVSWELDLFGRRRRETEAARAQVLSSEEGRRATVLTLVSSVAQTYINLRELERQLQIARDTAASRERSFLLFKDRFEGGTVSELELAQTQSLYEASS
ncbi:MAG TPA: RND transporter, partial [Massilia sp.]|nr:RND transporter [Massilia sp.]